MTLTQLDDKFKKAKRIDFNMNFPRLSIYFKSEMDSDVFYANLGEYFENQKLAADLDIREGFALTIFSLDTSEEIRNNILECNNNEHLQKLLKSNFLNERFMFGTGYIHNPSNASIELTNIQFESKVWLERLTIIKS